LFGADRIKAWLLNGTALIDGGLPPIVRPQNIALIGIGTLDRFEFALE